MIKFLIIVLIIALAIFFGYKYWSKIEKFLRKYKWGDAFLSWLHGVIFDFKMENPDRVPEQITWVFVAIIIIIGVVTILIAKSYQ